MRAIYEASIANVAEAIAAFDHAMLYDSTPRWAPPRLVASAHAGHVTTYAPPAWLVRALKRK